MLKRIAKIFAWILGSLVGIVLLAYVLLQIPAVQKKLTDIVSEKVGSLIGMHIEIGHVVPIPWDGLVLKDVIMTNSQNDTVFQSASVKAVLDKMQLDSSFLSIKEIALSKPMICVEKDSLGNLNIASLLDALSSSDTSSKFHLQIHEISVRDANVHYRDFTEEQNAEYGVNFSNVALSKLFIQAHDFSMYDGNYALAIDNFSCEEQSGLKIQYLHTLATVSDTLIRCEDLSIYTPQTKLSAQHFAMKYADFSDFSGFCEKVHLSANLHRSNVTLHDISYFASSLKEFPYSCTVEGEMEGTISDFSIENLHIGYGRSSQFVGSIAAKGLPNVEETNFVVNAKQLKTNQYDIEHTQIPPFDEEQFISLPSTLQKLTFFNYVGTIKGVWNDLTTKGVLTTNAGKISTDARLTQKKTSVCTGKIAFDDFDLSTCLATTILGKTTGNLDVDASFNSDSLIKAQIVGTIDKLECNDYEYSGVNIDGKLSARKFMGKFDIDDPNLKMRFGGLVDMAKDIPDFRFISKVDKANLDKLNLFNDSLASVAFRLSVDFQGTELDDMSGDVSIRDFQFSNAKGKIATKNIALNVEHENKRTIRLHSAFVDASVEGEGKYTDLTYSVLALLKKHLDFLPAVTEKYTQSEDFAAEVEIKQMDTIFSILQSNVRIAEHTTIQAQYIQSDNACNVKISSPKLSYNTMEVQKCKMDCSLTNEKISFDALAYIADSLNRTSADNSLKLNGFVKKGDVSAELIWAYRDAIKTTGTIAFDGTMISHGEQRMPKLNLALRPTIIQVEDSVWNVAPASIVVDSSSISIVNFCLSKDAKKISVDGVVSQNPNDVVVVNVENYDLSEINPLINNPRIRMAGPLQGRVRLKNLYATPLVFADVQSSAISFNDNLLGEMRIRSFWENRAKALLMKMYIRKDGTPNFAVEGKYVPQNDSVHFDVSLTDFKMETFSEILQGTVDNIAGMANGDVDIDGTLSNLTYSGEIEISNGSMLVNFTNVPYTFSGKLKARKTRFFFSDFSIADAMQNTGTIRGFLDVKEITNPHYLFDIQTPKMLVMKTTAKENDYFYGTIYYNGTAKIEGDLNETDISGNGTTLENTICSIPVSYSELSGSYDFLFFSTDSLTVQTYEKVKSSSGLTLNLTLNVTPDAQAQIIFDPKVGDIIKARGAGNLQVKMDKGGDLQMYGKYQIEEGDYLFTLKNLINKKLILQKGGTIAWNGDPLNAQVDLSANYETKASPQPLFDSTVNATKRIPVTCQAHLKNNLLSPDISYDILVPSSATQVSEVLSTLSEDEKTLQFFSLMLHSAFMAVNSGSGVGSSVSFEVLSNQFNNLLSQIDPDMDVSVNYRMGTDNVTNNEFEFGISRQFWNDRIMVNVNGYTDFGGTGETEQSTDQNQTNDFSGNVSVEMKLNKKGTFKVKGFSRSNEDELSEKRENTNGVGFFFTKDFNTVKDLFRKNQEE